MSNEIMKAENSVAILERRFELEQRTAKMYSASKLVPKQYQGNIADCTIALKMAERMGADPFMVMQNLYVVHGNPAFSAKFLIACVNACGRFTPLRYRMTGTKGEDSWGCIAWAKDESGEILESAEVTIAMAKAEGWFQKQGSKWQTMPEMMLQYRSAAFFTRAYAPDVSMGMMTREEVDDLPVADVTVSPSPLEEMTMDETPAPETNPEAAPVEINPETIPAAALSAAINTHKVAAYFAQIVEQFGGKVQAMTEEKKRECLKAMLSAQEAEVAE
jgi:hypothetical protein